MPPLYHTTSSPSLPTHFNMHPSSYYSPCHSYSYNSVFFLYLKRVLADKSSGFATESQQLYFIKCAMGMSALNNEKDVGGQNHGNRIVRGIGMIEWEVEAATTSAAATVPGWILVCELLQ